MTVKELITSLSKLPQDAKVGYFTFHAYRRPQHKFNEYDDVQYDQITQTVGLYLGKEEQ